jgi:hypothetical protein
MSVNRRSFLKSGALSALAAAAALVYAAPAHGQDVPKRKVKAPTLSGPQPRIPFGAEQSPLFYFTQETFRPYIGGIFNASAGSKSAAMTLIEVTEYIPKAAARMTTGGVLPTNSFVLKFTSADQLTDLTTIYTIEHGALGEFALFLTRRDGPAGTSLYEAVFNHVL